MMQQNTQMYPLVLAYGVKPGLTIMMRAMYVNKSIENTSAGNSGFNDLFLLAKFRLYRINTAKYVFGIAPHIATNIPVGSEKISSKTWNPELGLNISFRPRFLAVDVSTSYQFSDIGGKLDSEPGNILSFNTAISSVIPIGKTSQVAISPVLEFTYEYQAENKSGISNDLTLVSPGLTYINSNLSLEALLQIPVFQNDDNMKMKHKNRFIVGVKYMF